MKRLRSRLVIFYAIFLSAIFLSTIFLFMTFAAALLAQAPEDYKTPYDDWARNGARLERDAETARERLAARTDLAASDAARYETARQAFFEAQRARLVDAADRIQPLALPLETPADGATKELIATADAGLTKSIAALASDPDEGIQRLRRALDKERNALAAIKLAMDARGSAGGATKSADDSVQRAAQAADEQLKTLAASFGQSASGAARLAEAWRAYYRALANGARGISNADAEPVSGLRTRPPAPAGAPDPASSPSRSAATPPSAPVPAVRTANGLPLPRYTGAWEYLKGVSTFTKGLPPTMFDVVVKFENGQLSGTVSAAFDVLPKADPSVNFTFVGPMQAEREQSFPLETAEGVKGQVQLIPTSVFNLLEVRFTLENAAGKVSESDVVLIKKL
jgi:hypothetical protein